MSRRPRRPTCDSCGRPLNACWCRHAEDVETRHRVVVLQHPREARRALNSVRILERVLTGVIVRVGVNFDADVACDDPGRPPALLFPRVDGDRLDPASAPGPLTIVVLDGTWSQARTLVAANPWLAELPHIWLSPPGPSVYGVCRQPFPWGLCTLEAVAHALEAIDGDATVRERLLRPLRAMAGMHVASIGARPSPRG